MSLLWEWEQKRIKKHAKKIWRFHFPSIHMNLKPLPGHSLRDRWWKYWDITQPVALKPLRARDSGVILDQCSMSRSSAHRSVTETYWLAFQTSKANLMDGSKILLSRFSCFRVYSCLADLSKNRLTEIPPEVCLFAPLESLNLYHNCIKCIPEAIINLQMLTYLDIRWVIAKTILSVWGMYQCVLFYISQEVLVPHLRTQTGHEMLTWREAFPLLLKLNSQRPDTHCYILLCAVYNVGHCFIFIPSRNLLSVLPKYLFSLPLKVLLVSNNKLVSIPEEIGRSKELMELVSGAYVCRCIWTPADRAASVIPFPTLCLPLQDVSCNEIQALPAQVGRLQGLRELNIRKNCLHTLPEGQDITTHPVVI